MAVLSYESEPAALLLYVYLSCIRSELQRLPHSPHYINLSFILKCVPTCLAQHSVRGKGICFVLCPPPTLFLFSLLHRQPMEGDEESKSKEWGF